MNVTKETRRLIGQEISWLEYYIPEEAKTYRVQVIDRNILSLRPKMTWVLGWDTQDQIIFVSRRGDLIGIVGQRHETKKVLEFKDRFPFVGQKLKHGSIVMFPEDVLRALLRVGIRADEVHFVLHYEHKGRKFTLHRLPRHEKSFYGWLQKKNTEKSGRLDC